MTTVPQTRNYKLWQPPFNLRIWHDYVNQNMAVIDAVFARFIAVNNFKGPWANSTAYVVGDRVVDVDDGTIYTCSVSHTSAASPTTFAEDRVANSTHWTIFTFSVAFRGDWESGTSYAVGDFVSFNRKFAVCVVNHTSGQDFVNDQASGKWNVLIDGDVLAQFPTLDGSQASQLVRVDTTGSFYTLAPATCTLDVDGKLIVADLEVSVAPTFASPLGIASGGTNATTASGARAALGLAIGSKVQAWDSNLDTLSILAFGTTGLALLTDETAADALNDLGGTTVGKALFTAADAAGARTTLGLGTAATKSVGVAANNVVQLDGSAKIPAVDGSQLTNLPIPAAATQAEAEAATASNVSLTPGNVIYHPGVSKAWVTFHWDGTAIVIDDSFNISSVVHNATGDYTITFSVTFANANFVPSLIFDSTGNSQIGFVVRARTTTTIRVNVGQGSSFSAFDPAHVSVDIHGTLA